MLTDRFGSRRIINTAIIIVAVDFALMPWTSAALPSAIVAVLVWGLCGWGLLVPQQHRLIGIAPSMAPLLMGLNSAAVYIGVAASGVIGAAGISLIAPHQLGLIGACFIAAAFVMAQLAARRIARHPSLAPAETGRAEGGRAGVAQAARKAA